MYTFGVYMPSKTDTNVSNVIECRGENEEVHNTKHVHVVAKCFPLSSGTIKIIQLASIQKLKMNKRAGGINKGWNH